MSMLAAWEHEGAPAVVRRSSSGGDLFLSMEGDIQATCLAVERVHRRPRSGVEIVGRTEDELRM